MKEDIAYKIYICDDHTLFAESLQAYFSLQEKFKVVGHSSTVVEAFEDILSIHPHIVLIDYQLKVSNGIELLKKLKQTKIPGLTFILTMKNDPDLKQQAKNEGASGYLLKEISCEEMIEVFSAVLNNEIDFFDGTETINDDSVSQSKPFLTKREYEVAKLVCEGLSSNEIAKQLHLSVLTVSTHRKHILRKMNVKNPVELLRKLQQ